MRKYKGFTLAEVLITLGIIGIVSALTLPTLIYSYNKHITETRLKKFYSLFNQAIRLSIVDNEEYEGWDDYWAASQHSLDNEGNYIDKTDAVNAVFNKYLAPYMKVILTKKIKNAETNMNNTLYFLADGSAFSYRGSDTRDIAFFPKNPEKCLQQKKQAGICAFYFIFNPMSTEKGWKHHYKKGLEPYMYGWDGEKETLITAGNYGCNKSSTAFYCTELIRQNSWKIPSNYPLKIQY